MKVVCPGCGVEHFRALAWKHRTCVVVHAPVVHAEAPEVVHKRHGKYADAEARREYRRAWMASDRAKKRAQKGAVQ